MIPPELVNAIHHEHILILEDGYVLDAENVPLYVLDLILEWRLEIQQLIAVDDVRVCPAWDDHRKEWYREGEQRYRCAVCKRIRESMEGEHPS